MSSGNAKIRHPALNFKATADEGTSFRDLRQITVNDLLVRRSVDETLRLVQAFQFTDKHGEVFPAGWKPGGDAIKPDVQKSKEYFSKQK
uniref:thioredoxin-dependent peroxiredoxin n=1 Tax=Cebus imitator TaxID=2715852 RepID=A0A2K5SJT4_CEBIM